MPEIAATKDTASMTQAAPHAIMPHGGQNRRAARVQAAALRWLVRLAALLKSLLRRLTPKIILRVTASVS